MLTSNGPVRLTIMRQERHPTLRLVGCDYVARSLRDDGRAVLAEVEAEQYHALPSEERRRDWLAGRCAAKLAVRDVMRRRSTAPALHAIVIAHDESGAPTFTVDGSSDRELGLNVSLAHAGGVGLAAVADTVRCGSVGVDLEPQRPLGRRRLRAVLTRREWRVLKTGDCTMMPPPLALWMLKEAVFKADRGETFASPLDVELRWRDGRARVPAPAGNATGSHYRLAWRAHRGHVIACAVRTLSETG